VRIKVLGSAAGGGLPQWNCSCANCSAARAPRAGFRVRPRTQCQVAISADIESSKTQRWTLLNCSPDLRAQIEATPELHSQPVNGLRHSPITSAVFTSADIDCVLGLLHLREQQPLELYATATVRDIIRNDNSLFRMLEQKPEQARWTEFHPGDGVEVRSHNGNESRGSFRFRPIATGGDLPYYAMRRNAPVAEGAVTGLVIESGAGSKFAFMPGVREVSDEVLQAISGCKLLLIDGTFWTDDELIRVQGSGRTALDMGHIPVSGKDGTIERLSRLEGVRKVFIHMNNTNPMLNEDGDEYRQVRDAGWEIAFDGMEFEI
jgi:pyrroloquinoline quinone biosynthesis protein B